MVKTLHIKPNEYGQYEINVNDLSTFNETQFIDVNNNINFTFERDQNNLLAYGHNKVPIGIVIIGKLVADNLELYDLDHVIFECNVEVEHLDISKIRMIEFKSDCKVKQECIIDISNMYINGNINWRGKHSISTENIFFGCGSKVNIAHKSSNSSEIIVKNFLLNNKNSQVKIISYNDNEPFSVTIGNIMVNEGEINISNATLYAKNEWHHENSLAFYFNSKIYSESIKFDQDSSCYYHNIKLTDTQSLITNGILISKNAEFNVISSWENNGELSLIDSEIFLPVGKFINNFDGKLVLQSTDPSDKNDVDYKAFFQAKNMTNKGSVELYFAGLSVDNLRHSGFLFQAEKSQFQFADELVIDNDAVFFIYNNSIIEPIKNAEIIVSVYENAKLILDNNSKLYSRRITVHPNANLELTNSSLIKTNSIILNGQADISFSELICKRAKSFNKLRIKASSLDIYQMEVFGELRSTNSDRLQFKKFIISSSSCLFLVNSTVTGEHLSLEGTLSSDISTLKFNNIETKNHSNISGNTLTVCVETWQHQGELRVTNIYASGNYLLNENIIKSESADLGFNVLYNVGLLSAPKNLKIRAGISINMLIIHTNNLTLSSFGHANFVLVCAYNNQKKCLASFNFGLEIPNWPGIENILSLNNIYNLGYACLSSLFPYISNMITMAYQFPKVYESFTYLLTNLRNLPDIPLYELSEHINQVSSVANSLQRTKDDLNKKYPNQSTWKQVHQSLDSAKNNLQQNIKEYSHKEIKFNFNDALKSSKNGAMQLANLSVRLLGPKQANLSLVDENYGLQASNVAYTSSLHSKNVGTKFGLTSITDNSRSQSNIGTLCSLGSINLISHKFNNKGNILAPNINIETSELNNKPSQQNESLTEYKAKLVDAGNKFIKAIREEQKDEKGSEELISFITSKLEIIQLANDDYKLKIQLKEMSSFIENDISNKNKQLQLFKENHTSHSAIYDLQQNQHKEIEKKLLDHPVLKLLNDFKDQINFVNQTRVKMRNDLHIKASDFPKNVLQQNNNSSIFGSTKIKFNSLLENSFEDTNFSNNTENLEQGPKDGKRSFAP